MYLLVFGEIREELLADFTYEDRFIEQNVEFLTINNSAIISEIFCSTEAYLIHKFRDLKTPKWGEGLMLREQMIHSVLGVKPEDVFGVAFTSGTEFADKLVETIFLISGRTVRVYEAADGIIKVRNYNGLENASLKI